MVLVAYAMRTNAMCHHWSNGWNNSKEFDFSHVDITSVLISSKQKKTKALENVRFLNLELSFVISCNRENEKIDI